MKTAIDMLLLAAFLCAASSAQTVGQENTDTDGPSLSLAFERSELHFNYDLLEKARMRDETRKRRKMETELDKYKSRQRPAAMPEFPEKKKFITKGNAQRQYPSYIGRNVIGSMRAKRSGQIYIWH